MKSKTCSVIFRMAIVLVMAAFLSTVFLANNSFAAAGKKKSHAMTRMSAVEHSEDQIKQLQGTLGITAAQEPLWKNLTQVMRENAKEMDAVNKERAENTEPMNAVEHMKFHSQITQSHLAQLNKLIPAFEAFYNSLSDQQKNITNIVFRTGKYGRQGRHNRR
ncbi:MAG: Spy/CpxP family protein refolding chaperone [Smithellaceae bacterium]